MECLPTDVLDPSLNLDQYTSGLVRSIGGQRLEYREQFNA